MRQRTIVIAAMILLSSTPAAAELRIPCLWNPFGGCSVTLVSPDYAKRPVQPLNREAALAEVNAFRAANGRDALILDDRLCRAAAMQSETQAARSAIGHTGPGGSKSMDRAAACRLSCEDRLGERRLRAKIIQRRAPHLEGKF
jgi:hypothetical protein